MYGSAYVTTRYIKEKYPEIKKVRVVGMDSIKKELKLAGIDAEGGEEDDAFELNELSLE